MSIVHRCSWRVGVLVGVVCRTALDVCSEDAQDIIPGSPYAKSIYEDDAAEGSKQIFSMLLGG